MRGEDVGERSVGFDGAPQATRPIPGDLRGKARLTVKAAAEALEWSEAKIWRIETGQTSMRSLDVEQICRVYGAPDELSEALMGLAKETKGRGWWHAYGDAIPDGFDLYIGLEESASQLCWYSSELVPGLLQTEAYARTLIRADNAGVSDEEIERRVHVRIARKALLTSTTAAVWDVWRVVAGSGFGGRGSGGGVAQVDQWSVWVSGWVGWVRMAQSRLISLQDNGVNLVMDPLFVSVR